MKGATLFHLALVLLWSGLSTARANFTVVYWDADFGFTPPTVTVHAGDTVIWYDNDAFDFPVQITSDAPFGNPNYFSIFLSGQGDSDGLTFNNVGTFGYHDSYGFTATLIVNPVLALANPRSAGGQFLFDVSGLIVGKTNVLQVSSNLVTWRSVQTNVAASSSTTITNAFDAPFVTSAGSFRASWQWYRLVELP